MAITFPAAPTNGQVYTDTTSGQSWTWDGTKWKGSGSTAYWNRTGTSLVPATTGDSIKGPLVPTNGALGSRNAIINGMVNINQRGVTIAAAAVGAYGPDRWKKVDATNMTQIIEDVNVVHGAKYTLSWKGGTPQVLTAPGTGHWTLPNIPITATEIQLELGEVATPFERRSYGQELVLCQRYYCKSYNIDVVPGTNTGAGLVTHHGASDASNSVYTTIYFPVLMRAAPTMSYWSEGGNSGQWLGARAGASGLSSTLALVSGQRSIAVGASIGATQVVGYVQGHYVASIEL
jgi:hypothetical protein